MAWQAAKDLKHNIVQKWETNIYKSRLESEYPTVSKGFNKNQTSNLKNNNSKLGNNHAITFQLETVP